MARRALIDAWSHCHLTSIRALARQPWNRPLKFRHLTLRSNFSGDSGCSIRASRTFPRRCRYGVANTGARGCRGRSIDDVIALVAAMKPFSGLPFAGVLLEVGVRVSTLFPAGTK
jgi:hypothetical protein